MNEFLAYVRILGSLYKTLRDAYQTLQDDGVIEDLGALVQSIRSRLIDKGHAPETIEGALARFSASNYEDPLGRGWQWTTDDGEDPSGVPLSDYYGTVLDGKPNDDTLMRGDVVFRIEMRGAVMGWVVMPPGTPSDASPALYAVYDHTVAG